MSAKPPFKQQLARAIVQQQIDDAFVRAVLDATKPRLRFLAREHDAYCV